MRLLHVVDGVVDDRVEPDVDALVLGDLLRLALRAHVEADDDRVRRRGERTSDSVMPPTPDRMTFTLTVSVDSRASASVTASTRALHVGLEHDLAAP